MKSKIYSKKVIYKLFGASVIFLIVTCFAILDIEGSLFESRTQAPLSTGNAKIIQPVYVADFNDNEILVGASHNIFVGKIATQSGVRKGRYGPQTLFEVEVVDNIKGDLDGTVILAQSGGYMDGVLHVVEGGERMAGDTEAPEDYMLKPGSTYLLATRYNEKEDWYTLNSFHTAKRLISSDPSADLASLKGLADSDGRVQELRAAYPHEVLLQADIASGKTYNSYEQKADRL